MGIARYKFPFKYSEGDVASRPAVLDYDDVVVAEFSDKETAVTVCKLMNNYVGK